MPFKLICVAGARPNFMKIAPILRAFARDARFAARLVHTGQHYDERLSRVFFTELGLPRPDVELEVGSGTHAQQTAEIMKRFEPVLEREQPDAVLVVGDVNSTLACALVASKFVLASRRRPLVIHVEAGLRSYERDMPEEINRVLTDAISDVLFASEPSAVANLAREGVPAERVVFAGNVMIDTLLALREASRASNVLDTLALADRGYALVTLHRPSNVDDPAALRELLATIDDVARDVPIVFPIHPRTRARIASAGIALDPARWRVTEPFGYLDFIRLVASAHVVLTDSGGVQEETTVLGVPCITLRERTERPITCDAGTNQVAGTKRAAIAEAYARIEQLRGEKRPPQWDGHAAERIVGELARLLAL